ncbi:MAG: phage tail tape measure protein [Sulfuriferula sp.]
MNGGGTITATLKLDNSQFLAASAASQAVGKNVDDNLTGSADRVGKSWIANSTLVKGGLLAAAAAATVAAGASIKMAGDFQQSLNILKSVTGATAAEMAQLSEKARQLGNDVSLPGISAKDAAAAMTELGKAGVGVNDILGASKGVLSLAKAGQLEVADAATITARTMNAFALAGDKATVVADALAAGANASTADVSDMAYALSQAGSSAARMGLSVGDTVTALGLFSNAGINGSDAGTSLKTALQRLAAPTDEAAGAMKDLGLKFFDAKGNFVGIRDAAGQLQTKLGKLTQEQREQALATIFGSDASRAAGVLAAQGAAGFDKMSEAVNRQGAATDLAAAQNAGFKGALDNLKSTLETLGTDIGGKLLPPLTAFAGFLAENIKPILAGVTAGIIALGVAFVVGGGGAAFFAGVLAVLTSPVTLIVAAVAAVAAGLVVLEQKFGLVSKTVNVVKDAFTKFWDIIKPVRDFVAEQLKTAFESLISIGKQIGTTMQPVIDALKQILANKTVQDVLKAIGIALLAIAAAPVVIFFGLLIGALKIIATVLKFVADNFETIKKVILGVIIVALSPLIAAVLLAIGIFKAIVATIKFVAGVFTTVFKAIAAVVSTVFGLIAAVWNNVLKPVFDVIFFILNALFQIWFTIWSGIFQVVFTIVSTIAQILFVIFQGIFNFIVNTILTPIFNFFAAIFNAIWNVITTVVGAVWNVISSVFSAIFNFIAGILGAIWNTVSSVFNRIWSTISGIVSSIYNTVSNTFNNVKNAVVNAITTAINWVKNAGSDFLNAGKNIIDGIVNGISNAKDAVVNKIKEVCGKALDAVKNFFGIHSPSTVMAGLGVNLMQGLAGGIDRSGSAAITAVQGVSSSILGTVNGLTSNGFGDLGLESGTAGGGAAGIVQNNNIYNQVDLDSVTKELAWQIRTR